MCLIWISQTRFHSVKCDILFSLILLLINALQSTRTLQQATEARVVWNSFARKYVSRHFNIPRPENGSIEVFNTADLQKWVWARLAIDQIWGKESATPTKRTLNVHSDVVHMYLVPGGRWLITFRDTGHVDCYDLNLTEPPVQPLSEPIPEDLNLKAVVPGAPLQATTGEPPIVLATSTSAPTSAFEFTFVVSFTESQCEFYIPSSGTL